MSEEEIKAIETLEIEGTENNYLEVRILLNLVEKQQKEIEQLNEIKQQICNEELITQDYVQENFIKKDKIRAKIKEIDEDELMQKIDFGQISLALKVLNELLEEK